VLSCLNRCAVDDLKRFQRAKWLDFTRIVATPLLDRPGPGDGPDLCPAVCPDCSSVAPGWHSQPLALCSALSRCFHKRSFALLI